MRPDFTIRVYGLLIRDNAVLVSDELIRGMQITKFPGGGLEFGEGTIECLRREYKEETGLEIEVADHFYTTDFFVPSAFDNTCQVMSVYYFVKPVDLGKLTLSEIPHSYNNISKDQGFRLIPLVKLKEDDFTFPIDKKVASMLSKLHFPSAL